MADPDVLRRKLAKLDQYLGELESIRPASFEEYEASLLHRRSVERLIQLLVEVGNDINTHLLVSLGERPPEDYYEGFIRMGERGIIPAELAARLAPSAGERNILVHEYEIIRVVYESIDEAIRDYRAYGQALLAYLRRLGE